MLKKIVIQQLKILYYCKKLQRMKILKIVVLFFVVLIVNAQKIEVLNPPHWFIGMKNPKVELLLKGKNLAKFEFNLIHEDKAKLVEVKKFQNPNYVILVLDLKKVKKPKKIEFSYSTSFHNYYEFKYELKERKKGIGKQGISSKDLIYLIFPDRFVNGNENNDTFIGARETLPSSHFVGRKGGDLEGVISKLDYIKSLGFTSTWLTPVEENDVKLRSYHGYGFTSHFDIDKRIGTYDVYRKYVDESHKKGLKVVKDVVFNHINESHFLWEDKIDDSWFNPKILTNYRVPAMVDAYASQYDLHKAKYGWFVSEMPDFNQKNPNVAAYLTQYALWWIEEFDIDAFRIDTFAYPDNDYMWNMMNTVKQEYPNFFIFSEVWDSQESLLGKFDSNLSGKVKSNFSIGITDFEMQYAFVDLANEKFGWKEGLNRIYYTLIQDYNYKNANQNVTFLGNHDVDRFLTTIKSDISNFKLATTILLTTRGIPQWYYADEILAQTSTDPQIEGFKGDDALRRISFSGGFKGDEKNKFTPEGRTVQENDFINFFSKLANFRKNSKAITEGKLTHFVPEDDTYVYFRTFENEKVMIIINRKEEDKSLDLERFKEFIPTNSAVIDVISNETINLGKEIKLKAKTAYVLKF